MYGTSYRRDPVLWEKKVNENALLDLYKSIELAPYVDFDTINNAYKFLKLASGANAKTKLKQTEPESGYMDKLLYEIYSNEELCSINTEKIGNDYYMEWWEPKENETTYFDLVGTNYFLIYKQPADKDAEPIIELVLKENDDIEQQKIEDVEFKNTINTNNIVFHINQINAIYIKGNILPLKTKFNFNETNFKFDEFYVESISSNKATLFEHYVYKIVNKYENIEGNFKIPKPVTDTDKFDAYQYERLLLQNEQTSTSMLEKRILMEENLRKRQITLDNQIEQLEWEKGPGGMALAALGLVSNAGRIFSGAFLAGGAFPALERSGEISEEEALLADMRQKQFASNTQEYEKNLKKYEEVMKNEKISDHIKSTIERPKPPIQASQKSNFLNKLKGFSGMKFMSLVGGMTGMGSNIINYSRNIQLIERKINQSKKDIANETLINEFKYENDMAMAEADEILNISKAKNLINYAEVTDTEEMVSYLKKIKASEIHLMIIHPKEEEILQIERIYDKYGVDVNVRNWQISLNNIDVKKNKPYILQMENITSIQGITDPNEIEYIKSTLETGIKMVYLESLEESYILVEEEIVEDLLEQELIPKSLYDNCKADLAKLSLSHEDEIARNIKLDQDNKAAVSQLIAERDRLKDELEEAKKKDVIDEKLRNTYNTLVATHQQVTKELEQLKAKPPCEDVEELRANYDTMADAKKKADEELVRTVAILNEQAEKLDKCKEHLKTPEEQAREYKVEREQLIKGLVNKMISLIKLCDIEWFKIFNSINDSLTYIKYGDFFQYGKDLNIQISSQEVINILVKGGSSTSHMQLTPDYSVTLKGIEKFRAFHTEFTTSDNTMKVFINAYEKSYFGFIFTKKSRSIGIYSNSKPGKILYYLGKIICYSTEMSEIAEKIKQFFVTDNDIAMDLYPEIKTESYKYNYFRFFKLNVIERAINGYSDGL